MFGGLSVKGPAKASAPAAAASPVGNDEKKSETEAPAPAAGSSSAFSFMSSSSTPATAAAPEPAPAASAFSFMSSSTPAPSPEEPAALAKEEETAESGFSFLSQPAPIPASTEETTASPPVAAAAETTATSAFGFMSATAPAPRVEPSPPSSPAAAAAATPPSPAPAAAAAASSGFSFMSDANSNASPLPAPTSEVTKSSSTGSGMSALTSPDILGSSATMPPQAHQPVGSGVTFGGAQAAIKKKKPIKKRVRGTRVGTATGAAAVSSMPPVPMKTEVTQQEQIQGEDSREASLEAARRAEEFMNEKMKASQEKLRASQQAAAAAENNRPPSPPAPQPYPPAETPSYSAATTPKSPQGDDDYNAAKAAAEEAAKAAANSAQKKPAFRMGFGGLFQKNKKGPIMSASNKTIPAIPSELPSPAAVAVGGGIDNTFNSNVGGETAANSTNDANDNYDGNTSPRVETAAERIQREQEEINRAMAKRQLAIQQPSISNEDSDAAAMPSESGVGGFQPPSIVPTTTTTPKPATTQQASALSFTPAAPKPKPRIPTPEERLDVILKSFNSDAQAAMERVAQLREQRARLLEEKAAAKTMQLMASQQIAQAEAQQGAAAELEDFDLADRLGAVIDTHQVEKREQTAILMNIGKALEHLDEQRDAVVGAVAQCFGEVHTKLEKFANEQERKDRKDDTDSMQKFSIVAKQLSAENDRLIKDFKHVERDEELLTEEKNEVETAIGEQTEGLEKTKKDANEKLLCVHEEIVELQKLLREKESIATELKADLYQAETAISKVRSSFSRQLGRVQNKEAAIKEHRKEWKIEHERYEKEKTAHDKQVKDHSELLLKHEKLITRLNTEMKHAEAFKTIVEAGETVVYECAAAGDIGVFQEDGERQELAISHKQVVAGEAALLESNHILKAADAALVSLKKEQEELKICIPELESQKKQAAARRDFKTAGKASKEIKDLTARLNECEADLGDAAERVQKARSSLETIQKELNAKKAVLEEKEKEQGTNAMRDLAGTIKRLRDTKNKVCNETSGNNVQAIGASVLEGQIEALRKEGDSYNAKYGGWEAIWNEIVGKGSFNRAAQFSSKESGKKQEVDEQKTNKTVNHDAPDSADDNSDSSEDKISKFRALTLHLKEAEDSLEAAVAIEDYEKAAELDDVFQQLSADLLALKLTDEEMEIAMSEEGTNHDDKDDAGEDLEEESPEMNEAEEEQENDETELKQVDDEEVEDAAPEIDAVEDKAEGDMAEVDDEDEALEVDPGMVNEDSADSDGDEADGPPDLEDVESSDDVVQNEDDVEPVGDDSKSLEAAEPTQGEEDVEPAGDESELFDTAEPTEEVSEEAEIPDSNRSDDEVHVGDIDETEEEDMEADEAEDKEDGSPNKDDDSNLSVNEEDESENIPDSSDSADENDK